MKKNEINISAVKKLVAIASGNVKYFCQMSARLYGKLALREQLAYENETDDFSSIENVEADIAELKEEVINMAGACAAGARRLNSIAERAGFVAPLPGIDEMSLTEFMEAIEIYVATLVENSDYREWM